MRISTLPDSGLDLSYEDLQMAFTPFVTRLVTPDDNHWREEIARRKRKILRHYLTRSLLSWLPSQRRREDTITKEYTKAWRDDEYANYSLAAAPARVTPWEWREQHMFASDVGATRVRQILLSRVLEQLKPRHVLEVGCGNGVNLMLLACRFPEIAFTGVELTAQGHHAATRFQQQSTLPQPMQEYAPLALADPSAFRRIEFVQANAVRLPFPAKRFDLVITVLALEQMEQIRDRVLREIARVTLGHTLMIEPFRDVNARGWPRFNVIRRDYFRGRIDDLPAYGLEPVLALNDFPQEMFLKVCAVLAEKRS